jgi:hypothetical protein
MAALGFALLWAGYTAGLYGYSLLRGYENTLGGMVNPIKQAAWSTTIYTGTGIFPASSGSSTSSSSSPGSSTPASGSSSTGAATLTPGGTPVPDNRFAS